MPWPVTSATVWAMHLDLNDDEAEALRSALDQSLSELTSEIADTDNHAYRAGLQANRDLLRSVRSRL